MGVNISVVEAPVLKHSSVVSQPVLVCPRFKILLYLFEDLN